MPASCWHWRSSANNASSQALPRSHAAAQVLKLTTSGLTFRAAISANSSRVCRQAWPLLHASIAALYAT
eukprot:3651062-Pyramimonas_sp.AAC.1